MIELFDSIDEYPTKDVVKAMSKMEPLEVCVVVGGDYRSGHWVMRTASSYQFEVIDLSEPDADSCWTHFPGTEGNIFLEVRELREGEVKYLRLSK